MENKIDLKALWAQQPAGTPNTGDLFNKLRKLKRSNYLKLAATNILLIGASVFVVSIWIRYNPQMISTKIGIVMTVLAMVIFILSYNRLYPLLKKIDDTLNNTNYLQNLVAFKEKQKHLHTTMMSLYFLMLSSGVFLYMIEPSQEMSRESAILAYALTAAWIAFNWFYIRPRTIRKQQQKTDEVISRVERLSEQLKGE